MFWERIALIEIEFTADGDPPLLKIQEEMQTLDTFFFVKRNKIGEQC